MAAAPDHCRRTSRSRARDMAEQGAGQHACTEFCRVAERTRQRRWRFANATPCYDFVVTSNPAPGAVRRVMVVGPDDEARRSLQLLATRCGFEVVAAELDGARKHVATNTCDVVLAAPDLAIELCAEDAPPVIAVARTREVALAMSLLQAGVADVITEPLDELSVTLAVRRDR